MDSTTKKESTKAELQKQLKTLKYEADMVHKIWKREHQQLEELKRALLVITSYMNMAEKDHYHDE